MRLLKLLAMLVFVALPVTFAQNGLPDIIVAQRAGFHPEGIEWDEQNERFLTGSFTEGTIFEIADDGTVTPFIEDEALMATLGLHIDEETNRLLVANSEVSEDPEALGSAQLAIFDLDTGEQLQLVDLGALLPEGHHLANDVTTDPDGNAYITDSLSPAIYKVTPDGEASIFTESELFVSDFFGLNGIEYHPDGYLLVAVSQPGALYKIPLEAPDEIAQIEMEISFAPDGILLHPDGTLIVVAEIHGENGDLTSEVLELTSEDDWNSAWITNRVSTDPALSASTVTLRDGIPYIVYSHFYELFSGQSVDEFEILRIDFED